MLHVLNVLNTAQTKPVVMPEILQFLAYIQLYSCREVLGI